MSNPLSTDANIAAAATLWSQRLIGPICGWCDRPIIGRHRIVEPFAFRGWVNHQPIMLTVRLVFHRDCWRTVRAVAGAAESLPNTWRPDDPPLTYCDCGADTYPGVDHYCDPAAPVDY